MKSHSSHKTVLLLENIHPEAVRAFSQAGWRVQTHTKAMSEDELIAALPGVQMLGIRSKTSVSRAVIESAKVLEAVGAFCIGTNHIDLAAATERGVAVFNAPYSNTRSVVELTLAEIIMLMRRATDASTAVHAGGWVKSATGCFEVRGKKLGILGYGNIGAQLSVVAEALGMQVAFYDIRERLALGNARKLGTLKELLAWSDVVTVHVDGRKENTHLIGTHELGLMKRGSYFINNARGHVVDVEALAASVQSGHLAGCAVDVFPHEPKGNEEKFVSPLQGLPNTILTPHIGGSTEEAQAHIGDFVANQLLSYMATGAKDMAVA